MNVLDLFSGIGGFSLGLERAGMRTVAFCEIEPFCRAVLAKHWPGVPCYDDVRSLTAARLVADGIGAVDVICGGYPCQPFSHAGKQRGEQDPRHLWPEMRRLVGEVRPAWVVAENVVGHVTLGLDQVLADLEADGYAGRAIVVPAAAVDAPHIRQRVWIVARDRDRDRESACPVDAEASGLPGDLPNATGGRRQEDVLDVEGAESLWSQAGFAAGVRPHVADADSSRPQGHGRLRERVGERTTRQSGRAVPYEWLPEPGIRRVAHGIPRRVDRLRALGNAVVPQVVQVIGEAIMRTAR